MRPRMSALVASAFIALFYVTMPSASALTAPSRDKVAGAETASAAQQVHWRRGYRYYRPHVRYYRPYRHYRPYRYYRPYRLYRPHVRYYRPWRCHRAYRFYRPRCCA